MPPGKPGLRFVDGVGILRLVMHHELALDKVKAIGPGGARVVDHLRNLIGSEGITGARTEETPRGRVSIDVETSPARRPER